MPNKVEISLEHALIIVPAIAAKKSAVASLMKGEIENQVRSWYAQGVSLCVDPATPLGKQLKEKGYIK